MAAKGFQPVRELPRWVLRTGSAVIGFHLFALGILVLAVQSGPWWVEPLGQHSPTQPPYFAGIISDWTTVYYLFPLGLSNPGHFDSNQTMNSSVRLEVHLAKDEGATPTVLTFPDPRANAWVRQRQSLLIQKLSGDQIHMPNQDPSVKIAAPGGKEVPAVFFFHEKPDDFDSDMVLYEAPHYEFKRLKDRYQGFMFFFPSESSLIVAKSFARYLQQTHGVVKVDVVRESRQPIMPALMFPHPFIPDKLLVDDPAPTMAPNYLKTLTCRFGDGQPKEWPGLPSIPDPKGAP